MSEPRGVSAETLLEAAEAGRLRVPVEVGAFIVLQCVEQLSSHPRDFAPGDVRFDDEGGVLISSIGRAGEDEAARAATALLRRLLLASAGASPSALLSWLERSQSEKKLSLEEMRDEVEAALVPLNREAATRLLARFIRSSQAAVAAPPVEKAASEAEVDAELDRFLGLAHEEPPPTDAELLAPKLSENKPRRGPSVVLIVLVLLVAAGVGLALSQPELLGLKP